MATFSWAALCRQADERFDQERRQGPAYEFSNGRVFKEPYPLYRPNTSTGTST